MVPITQTNMRGAHTPLESKGSTVHPFGSTPEVVDVVRCAFALLAVNERVGKSINDNVKVKTYQMWLGEKYKNDKGWCAEGIDLWMLRWGSYYRIEQFGTCFFLNFSIRSFPMLTFLTFFSQSTYMLVSKNGGSAKFPRHLNFTRMYD